MFLEVLGAAVDVSCVLVTLIKCRDEGTWEQPNKVAVSSTGGAVLQHRKQCSAEPSGPTWRFIVVFNTRADWCIEGGGSEPYQLAVTGSPLIYTTSQLPAFKTGLRNCYKFCILCVGNRLNFHEINSTLPFNILKGLCGGGIECFHRSPASRKRRRKGNPVPGGISGPPCSWGI
jgi:hypothetical protein